MRVLIIISSIWILASGKCPDGQVNYECMPCIQSCQGPVFCTNDCTPGCACPIDTVTDEKGNCVNPNTCPLQCRLGGIYYPSPYCAPSCTQSCDAYLKGESLVCNLRCQSDRCGCPHDYVVDQAGCLSKKQCEASAKCPSGQRYYTEPCAPCERTCDNIHNSDFACPKDCASNICRCAPGFVKLKPESKECIPEAECPSSCDKRGEVLYTGSQCLPCERTCDNYYYINVACPRICLRNICMCRPGYVRHGGECIPTNRCPTKPICGRGERFYSINECKPCEQRCPNYVVYPGEVGCTNECINERCGCQEGYKRDSSHSCVEEC